MRGNIIAHSIVLLILLQILFNVPQMESTILEETQNVENLDNAVTQIDPQELLSNTPTAFTENHGQMENDDVRFYDQGGTIWFTDDGMWIELREYAKTRDQGGVRGIDFDLMKEFREPEAVEYKRVVLKQEFMGTNEVKPIGLEPLGYYSNFFYGNDSSKWCTEVPNYQKVFYENLYDGIDLRYYTNEKGLKYDFIVHPGADLQQIRIKYQGAEKLEIDDHGNLIIKTLIKDIVDGDLFIYQNEDGFQQNIKGRFVKYDEFEYGFMVESFYNKQKPIIIDPLVELGFSTNFGGSAHDTGSGLGTDNFGNIYLTGVTTSTDLPKTPGAYNTSYNGNGDVFIAKFSPTISKLVYSTFIGGGDTEDTRNLAIDSNGNCYVTGRTISSNFPTTSGAFDKQLNGSYDIFVLKLDSTGSNLMYSTYIGGDSYETDGDIAIDINGSAFITGSTNSTNFPTTSTAFDRQLNGQVNIFVLKLNSTGSDLIYSTYMGGTSVDGGVGIAVDPFGNAYITGTANSQDFPTTPGAFDRTKSYGNPSVFVFKLNYNGSMLIYSTYVEGLMKDESQDIVLDKNNNAIVTGYTWSSNFPTTPGAFDTSINSVGLFNGDIFVFKLNHNGSALNFSTFIGGDSRDDAFGITVDSSGNLYITGWTLSSNFPTTSDAYNRTPEFHFEAFMFELSANGSTMLYSTYISANNFDSGYDITLDSSGDILIAGYTNSTNFPTTPGAYDRTNNGYYDAFIFKFSIRPIINITSISLFRNTTRTNLIYSRLSPYTLRINITDTFSLQDLEIVRVILDPLGSNIQLGWDRVTNQFSKILDQNNVLNLESSSKAYNNSWNKWTVDFNVTFNWNYPGEVFHNVQAYATSVVLSSTWFNLTKLYRVENDLVFIGNLSVNGEDNRSLNENDLIRGGEKLNWTGLKPVYEGTTDVYPPADEFDITIWNEAGNSWSDSPASGRNFTIQANADHNSDLDGNIHVINLSGIPTECDATNKTFTIKIDGDNVIFSNPTPDNITWQTDSNVKVSVNITDIGGGVVNGSSVMYSISIDNGKNWSDWKILAELKSAMSIKPNDIVAFHEGKNNLIKWKAMDTVGNGPTESKPYRLLVDTEGVEFSNAWPMRNDISLTEQVEVGITISDKTSGVNSSTIEYAISTDMGEIWRDWRSIQDVENRNNVDVSLNLTFPNGTGNRIKWRAYDVAGNGPLESKVYNVNVNTWLPIPKVTLLRPENGSIIRTRSIELSWMLVNWKLQNVTYDIYLDTVDLPMVINQSGLINTSLKFYDLIDGATYYWIVIPRFDNNYGSCISGGWSFTVDIPIPSVTLISPPNGSIIQALRPTFVWTTNYDGTEELAYDIYVGKNGSLDIEILNYQDTNYLSKNTFVFNETYYWKVVPKAGGLEGFESETWWFTVRPKNHVPTFSVNLILEPSIIEIKPGKTKYINAIVTNLGEIVDNIVLSKPEIIDPRLIIEINQPNMIDVDPNSTAVFNITVRAIENAKEGEISIMVIAASANAAGYDQVVEKRATLSVNILGQEKHDTGKSTDASWYWIILLIIFVIVIVLFFVGLILKRKKELQPETQQPEVTTVTEPTLLEQPSELHKQVISTPVQTELTSIPTPIVEDSPSDTLAPVEITQPPQVGQTPQTITPEQIIEVPEMPRLPPANIETKEENVEESTEEAVESSPTTPEDNEHSEPVSEVTSPSSNQE